VIVGLRERRIEAVVLDIEGTTTPIAFVYDVLFPFARAHLRQYLTDGQDASLLERLVAQLRIEWLEDDARGDNPPRWPSDRSAPTAGSLADAASYVEWLMDRDRKSPGLKMLQGLIWERGYRSGELKGEVFADVPGALDRWRGAGLDLAIYSSGSELAQRLLFGSTPQGDLTRYFSRFFDTGVGAKTSVESYGRIATELGRPAARIVFVSDVTVELDAARAAGFETLLCVRPGNRPQPPHRFTVVESFDQVEP